MLTDWDHWVALSQIAMTHEATFPIMLCLQGVVYGYRVHGDIMSLYTHTCVCTTPGIEQRDRRVAASIQFQVGDKCQVRIAEGQTYRGEVSRLDVTPGCHTVSVGCRGGDEGEGWR